MKNRRILALALAVMMLLAMAAPAMADDIVIEVGGGVEEIADLGGIDLSELEEGESFSGEDGAGAEVSLDEPESTEPTGEATEEVAGAQPTQAEGVDLSQAEGQVEEETQDSEPTNAYNEVHILKADGTTSEAMSFSLAKSQVSAGDTIVLDADLDTTSKIEIGGRGTLAIDLNGHDIDFNISNDSDLIYVSQGSTLTIKDTFGKGRIVRNLGSGRGVVVVGGTFNLEGGTITGNNTNGVYVDQIIEDSNGAFNMTGGAITGSSNSGVEVHNASFTMSGGKISGNTAEGRGGGVYVVSDQAGSEASFTMSGGTISGNSAARGGGVYVVSDQAGSASFTMNGGTISDNHATDNVYGHGGGVYVVSEQAGSASFTMSGGVITGNAAQRDGGGVYFNGGEFKMSGGAIGGNTVQNDGGGVYFKGNQFEMSGGTIGKTETIGGNTSKNGGGGVYISGGTFTMTRNGNGAITGNSAAGNEYGHGGGVYVGEGSFIMSGGTISGNEAKAGICAGGGVYVIGSKASFTLEDGAIEGNYGEGYGGGVGVLNSTFTMSGGTVEKNHAISGGGVYVTAPLGDVSGSFIMNGGAITENTAIGSGGGVLVEKGSFTMKDGTTISGNEAALGGGVGVYGDFTMEGGAITGNHAIEDDDHYGGEGGEGGGVYTGSGCFEMSGGKIEDNTATKNGGGVWVDPDIDFKVSGGPLIWSNTADGKDDNVYLDKDGAGYKAKITVGGKLTDEKALIAVSTGYDTGIDFTKGYLNGSTAEPGEYFASDDPLYGVIWNKETKEAILAPAVKADVADYEGVYDGKAHGVTIDIYDPHDYDVTIEYQADDDEPWSTTAPEYTEPGEYALAVRISADGYASYEDVASVTIHKLKIPAPVAQLAGWTYGEAANKPELISENPDGGAVTFTYAADQDGEFTATVPTDAGDWYVRASVAETEHCEGGSGYPQPFTIEKADPELKVSVSDVTYGEAPAPVVSGNPGGGEVKFLYASAVVANARRTNAAVAWSETAPTQAGDYLVKAVVAETKNYRAGVSDTAKFRINRAKVTVKAQDASKTEGEKDPELKYTAEGLVGSDSITGALAREAGEKPGKYAITVGTLSAGANYEIAFTGAALTITAKAAPQPEPTGKTEPEPTTKPTAKPTAKPEPEERTDAPVVATVTACGKDALKIAWTKVAGAKGYDVYLAKCGEPLKQTGSTDKRYVKVSGLKKQTLYRVVVKAWTREDGKKVYIATSPTAYAYTGDGNGKTTNPKCVTVKTSKVSLKVGKKTTIKASVKGVKSGKKVLDKGGKVRYVSSDPSVAKVNSKGKVTAVSKGTCVIYVLASNGVYKTVTVKVK